MPQPISPVDMSTAAFIGHIPDSTESPGTITRFRSWNDFNQVARLSPNSGRAWNDLAHAVYGFFLNGGSACAVVECRDEGREELALALEALSGSNDFAILTAPGYTTATAYYALTTHCEARRDRLAIFDGPAAIDGERLAVMAGQSDEAGGWRMPPPSPGGTTTLYTPWIRVADPEGAAGATVLVPASGHIAGLWARTDAAEGVHKAPANAELRGALDVTFAYTTAHQNLLTPHGVNTVRAFPGRGIVVWGARTLSPDPDWRYVPTRRFLMMVTESIRHATGWVVFEPNDEPLWAQLRRVVEDFLFSQWRNGALAGSRPEMAFFVRCDRTTMTQLDIDNGRVHMQIGVAPTRPAEFIIQRISW